jgi:hypothetical protein
MKIEKYHKIGFFDVDHQLKLRIQSVARFFQEMATFHSTKIGAGPDDSNGLNKTDSTKGRKNGAEF